MLIWTYRLISLAFVLIGLLGIALDTPGLLTGETNDFFGPGMEALLALLAATIGTVNLLNDRYGATAIGVRWTAIAATSVAGVIVLRMNMIESAGFAGYMGAAALLLLSVFAVLRNRSSPGSPPSV